MELQKEMLAGHYRRLEAAPETGEPVVYTFVPGNLTELIRSFDALPVLPEINALQSAMRGKSQAYIAAAERAGHSEDVCSYVKCDVGMMKAGNVGPTGTRLPKPDLLLLSYTGCYTFMKWFELLREEYGCPVVFLHVPYQGDGRQTPEQRDYVVRQIRKELIPALERITRPALRRGAAAREPREERRVRGGPRRRPGVGAPGSLPHRRVLRRRLLRRTDLLGVPRHAGGRRLLPGAARGGGGARERAGRARRPRRDGSTGRNTGW